MTKSQTACPIPNPEPGRVVAYPYLWRHEYKAGQQEGRKDRPSIIVLAVEREIDGAPLVAVLPITHSAPGRGTSAIEISQPVKRHLRLVDDSSSVVFPEGLISLAWPRFAKNPQHRPLGPRISVATLL
ncbi:hypothetical protein [Rhodopila sp.]|uniref:hypothetical protein n=1 Tax=Rhodopila sp. TaxID=2480087 RepID=UPI003D0C5215